MSSYFAYDERSIFLSFLNREAKAVGKSNRTEVEDIRDLEILSLSHCATMTANISQIIEHASEARGITPVILKMIEHGIITTTSNTPGIDEFIASRQKMYRGLSKRYEMYFNPPLEIQEMRITSQNSYSMTQLLRRDLMDMTGMGFLKPGAHSLEEDFKALQLRSDEIIGIVGSNPEIAITRDSIARCANPQQFSSLEYSAAGRFFSARYFDHYKEHHSSTIPTGTGLVGFTEDLSLFPHYDLKVLNAVVSDLGYAFTTLHPSARRNQIYEIYGSDLHRRFVLKLNAFIAGCAAEVINKTNSRQLSNDNVPTVRAMIINTAATALHDTALIPQSFASIDQFLSSSIDTLSIAGKKLSNASDIFKETWKKMSKPDKIFSALVLTATDSEDRAFRQSLISMGYTDNGLITACETLGSEYMRGANRRIIHVRSSAGASGPSGSTLVSADAMKEFAPDYVISVGICFGLKEGEHSIGDVIVAERLVDYESRRIGEDQARDRGMRVPSASRLLAASRQLAAKYDDEALIVRHGEIISGQKLVDSREFLHTLRTDYPDAIGGEMEGTGIVGAASLLRVDWLIVKAICDWGNGKHKGDQPFAAGNACKHALSVINAVFDLDAKRYNSVVNS